MCDLPEKHFMKAVINDDGKFAIYLRILNFYFRGKFTRNEMNKKLEKLLRQDCFDYHYEFCNALMYKASSDSKLVSEADLDQEDSNAEEVKPKSTRKSKKQISVVNNNIYLESFLLACHLPRVIQTKQRYALQRSFPDIHMLRAHIHTLIWNFENDMDAVTEESVAYLAFSSRILITDIIRKILSQRYLDRENYNSISSISQESPLQGKITHTKAIDPITIGELYDVLKVNQNLIPVRNIYKQILKKCFASMNDNDFTIIVS